MDPLRPSVLRVSHNVGPTAALAIVIAIGTISYLDDRAYRTDAAAAEQSRTIIDKTEDLLSELKDTETGERGFVLTGDPRYLEPYETALPRIESLLQELGQPGFVPANHGDLAGLGPLVRDRLAELSSTIATRRSAGAEAALAIVTTGHGKATMDRIRELVARVIETENREFRTRAAAAEAHANLNRSIIILGTIVLALLLFISTRYVDRLVRTQDRLIVDLGLAKEREARAKATFETTLRSVGDALIATDNTGVVQFMNPVAETLTGWTATTATGRRLPEVFRIVNETTRHVVDNPVDLVLRDGVVVGLANHTILLARDGREIPIDDSGAPIRSESGDTSGVVLVFRDVTQRRRTQQQLEESERRYRLLFDSHPEPMWVYDRDTLAFLMVNNSAVERYGYTREEFLRMTLRDIRPAEDVPRMEADVREGEAKLHTDGPWRHRKKDGSIIFVEITAHPIRLGSVQARLVMAKDITERRRLEEQLRQSQKLEAVGHLAGGIAHDFNNLLTVIEGYAEMIDADQSVNHPQRMPAREILVASQRAASLTHQLLAFSRRQVLQPQRINLNANVAQTQKLLARLLGEDIQIVAVLAPNLQEISADPGQIDQIVINMAVNARDAMERGGTLTIETSNVVLTDEEAARHVGLSPGRYVRLAISDTGHGMDEETQRHIFEPFFTTKAPDRGTGLGLSTVYGIVRQSGGAIETYSEPGRGTSFKIYLPAAVGTGPGLPEPAAPAPASKASEAVLVVEDDETVRTLVVTMLTSLGYTVLRADTPDEALRLAADNSVHIDLLLTDMVLPQTDGATVAQHALVHRPDLKTLFMSGYTEHAVLRRRLPDSPAAFLQKPFTQSVLAKKVREVLDSGSEKTAVG